MQSPSLAPGVRGRGMATVACLLVVCLTGCGGGGPQTEQAQIRHVLRAYLRAQAHGRGRAACALLAPAGRAELVSAVSIAARGLISLPPTCPRAVRLVRAAVGRAVLDSLVKVRIRRVRVIGLVGSVRIRDPGRRFPPQVVEFVRGAGGWRITGIGG
ncbi:MAG TPA: hypothetical protein VE983_11245 [Solirubrobacteraceae bacterium]|nr:hypothetical protein [Solirubrobacteraceae bacterium]